MSRNAVLLAVMGVTLWCALPSSADVVIQASKAAVKTEGGPLADDVWNLWSQGRVGQPLRIAADGTHQVVIRAWGSPAAGMWPEMALLVDGRPAKTVTVDRTERADFRFNVELTEGIHEIAAAFLNDAVIGGEDRNLYLDRLTIIPPKGAKDAVFRRLEQLLLANQGNAARSAHSGNFISINGPDRKSSISPRTFSSSSGNASSGSAQSRSSMCQYRVLETLGLQERDD